MRESVYNSLHFNAYIHFFYQFTKGSQMLFTREFDYALRILRNLNEKEPTGVSSIVSKEYMTISIAYKVARKLEKGGLISSVRGQSGGYLLSRPLSEITFFDIYSVTDPDAFITECLRPNYKCPLNSNEKLCGMHKELERIQEVFNKELKLMSMQDMIIDSE